MLRTAATWLAGQLKSHVSQTVTISRSVNDPVEVTASIGQTDHEIEDSISNVITRVRTRDFLIDAADYAPTGTASLPQQGDKIRETQGGVTYVHEVLQPGQGIPHFRYMDDHRTKLRIHTIQVDTE